MQCNLISDFWFSLEDSRRISKQRHITKRVTNFQLGKKKFVHKNVDQRRLLWLHGNGCFQIKYNTHSNSSYHVKISVRVRVKLLGSTSFHPISFSNQLHMLVNVAYIINYLLKHPDKCDDAIHLGNFYQNYIKITDF